MAKKTVYTDDLDSSELADAGTVSFSYKGITYEMDLSSKNEAKLAEQLGPWIAKARTVKNSHKNGKATAPAASGYNAEQLKAVREWAGSHGYNVSDRGRVPQEVLKAYEENQALNEPKFSSV